MNHNSNLKPLWWQGQPGIPSSQRNEHDAKANSIAPELQAEVRELLAQFVTTNGCDSTFFLGQQRRTNAILDEARRIACDPRIDSTV